MPIANHMLIDNHMPIDNHKGRIIRSASITVLFLLCMAVALPPARHPGQKPVKSRVSDHFDGTHFHNRAPYTPDNFHDSVKLFWAIAIHRHRWPTQPDQTPTTSTEASHPCGVRATIIGHATVLLQVDGLNILTDPVMGSRIGANRLLSVKRESPPGLSLQQLPVIDVILLSHDHFDHLDLPSLQAILKRQPAHAPLILTGLGNAELLLRHGIGSAKEMDWGDSVEVSGKRIYFLEAVHESGRFNYVEDKTLWGSFLIEAPSAKLYFAGDSAYSNHFKQIGQTFGPISMSFLPIGAYEPHALLYRHHMDPRQAIQAHIDLRSERSIGIHFDIFNSAADRFHQPVEDLGTARNEAKLSDLDFVAPKPGDVFSLPCRVDKSSKIQQSLNK